MKLKKLAEKHGLTPEGVDYALTQYQIVINEITHGMMSKLSYDAKDIIQMAQERWCDTCERAGEVEIKSIWSPSYGDYVGQCEECGAMWIPADCTNSNYCPGCGKAIKWE